MTPSLNNPLRRLRIAFETFRLKRKWKIKAKKRERVAIRVSSVIEFLDDLERHGIETCVLRWPEEVPVVKLTGRQVKKDVDEKYGDVDVLVSIRKLDELLPFVARHRHVQGLKCDVYSVAGVKGTQFMRYPYYPPLRAMQLMAGRQRHRRGFYCVTGHDYICSLVYHLVYHKGLASGISLGTDGAGVTNSDQSYVRKLQIEAEREGVALPSPVTLENLENWLGENDWQMPYDLLVRWPLQDKWIHHLQSEKKRALSFHKPPPYEFVYLLREDIENTPLEAQAEEMLGKKFEITQSNVIPPAVRKAMASWLRGGTWSEKSYRKIYLPYKFIVCVDHHWVQSAQVSAEFPHVDNENFFFKHEVRKALCATAGRKIYGIHGSDNAVEANYMKTVWRKYFDEQKPARVV